MSTSEQAVQPATAIHLLRSGHSVAEVADSLGRSVAWVYKWRQRFKTQGWAGLVERSRAPHQPAHVITPHLAHAICQARSELEAEARQMDRLHYVGAEAIQARLVAQGVPAPSSASIERVLKAAGMSRPKRTPQADMVYPHLKPTAPQELVQVDIVPRFLNGGASVACFNAIDVVSHLPTGRACPTKRARDAVAFLIHVWQTLGISRYTQLDNEGCFSGGFTHRRVLGQVVRLALLVGTEVVFSPFYHPQSNGHVERFHQDYVEHVWAHTDLADVAAVNSQGDWFFDAYRTSTHVSALQRTSPQQAHGALHRRLAPDFTLPSGPLPLSVGRVHFMRRIQPDGCIRVLNEDWPVPNAPPDTGVWVTLELTVAESRLSIYDGAPDAAQRRCWVSHPFPLAESVQPRPTALTIEPTPSGLLRGMTRQLWTLLRRHRTASPSTMS